MCETLVIFHHCFSPKTKTQPHLPPTLNCYITHLTRAGPWDPQVHKDDPPDQEMSQLVPAASCCNSVDHNYYKAVNQITMTNPLQPTIHS